MGFGDPRKNPVWAGRFLAFGVFGMLALAGCAEAPTVAEHQPVYRDPAENVIDHFLCYQIQPPNIKLPAIRLIDQFNRAQPQPGFLVDRESLCVPVAKGGKEIARPASHLVCYTLGQRLPPNEVVLVTNQIEQNRQLTVMREVKLCLPSGKTDPPGSTPPPIPVNLDHFKCYLTAGDPFQRKLVRLRDQFTAPIDPPLPATMVDRAFLCAPAEKIREQEPPRPMLNGNAHLLCYTLDPVPFKQRQVRITNQFEPAGGTVVTVVRPTVLCVPSSKTLKTGGLEQRQR